MQVFFLNAATSTLCTASRDWLHRSEKFSLKTQLKPRFNPTTHRSCCPSTCFGRSRTTRWCCTRRWGTSASSLCSGALCPAGTEAWQSSRGPDCASVRPEDAAGPFDWPAAVARCSSVSWRHRFFVTCASDEIDFPEVDRPTDLVERLVLVSFLFILCFYFTPCTFWWYF